MKSYLKNKISEMYLSNNNLYRWIVNSSLTFYPFGFSFLFTRLAWNHNSLSVFFLSQNDLIR